MSLSLGGILILLILLFLFAVDSIHRLNERWGDSVPRVACEAHLKTIGSAILLYANDHAGKYPDSFQSILVHAELTSEVLTCPATNDEPALGTTTAERAANLSASGGKQHLSYVYCGTRWDSKSVTPYVILAYEPLSNHGKGINVLFGDGHVDWFAKPEAEMLIAELQAGHNPPREEKLN